MDKSYVGRLGPESGLTAVRTFAHRLTRRALLRRFCQSDHPVLAIEEDLVEMAKSKLHESILASFTPEDIPKLRPALEMAVKASAMEKVAGYDEDQNVKDEIVLEVCSVPLDDILTPAH